MGNRPSRRRTQYTYDPQIAAPQFDPQFDARRRRGVRGKRRVKSMPNVPMTVQCPYQANPTACKCGQTGQLPYYFHIEAPVMPPPPPPPQPPPPTISVTYPNMDNNQYRKWPIQQLNPQFVHNPNYPQYQRACVHNPNHPQYQSAGAQMSYYEPQTCRSYPMIRKRPSLSSCCSGSFTDISRPPSYSYSRNFRPQPRLEMESDDSFCDCEPPNRCCVIL